VYGVGEEYAVCRRNNLKFKANDLKRYIKQSKSS
jgi:hypothetical protein